MPIGRTCRSCGAPLPPDLGWCGNCFAPIRLHARRVPIHEPGSYVGPTIETPRTSRWRAGPTTFGPAGRILSTLALLLLFPWWGVGGGPMNPFFLWSLMGWLALAGLVLRSIWKPVRIVDERPPRLKAFRERHRLLGRELRLDARGRTVLLAIAATGAVAAWLGLDDAGRYIWAVIALVAGLGIFLGIWNDL